MAAARAAGFLGLCSQLALVAAGSGKKGQHAYPTRGINVNRSGYTPDWTAPFPLPREPSWKYEVYQLNRHQTSAIDADLNVYAGSDTGVIQSFDKIGRQRWMVQAGSSSAQNPALSEDSLYTSTQDGYALAFHKDTGKELWRTRISDRMPGDTYSPAAFDDYVIYPAGAIYPYGSPDVVCLNRRDGSIRWRYSVGDKYGGVTGEMAKNGIGPKYTTVNLAACIWDGMVIFNDVAGAVYSLSLESGKEIWYVAPDDKDMYTLGGSCCGPNGKVYVGFSSSPGQGALQALDMKTGEKLWRAPYEDEVHSAPAVGYINGVLAAVVGIGQPPGIPELPHELLARAVGFGKEYNFPGLVVASNADTGKVLWTFRPPPWKEAACAGSTWDQICLPDLWSGSTIDAAGTVWINWSGGVLYGLRDANGDGTVDVNDPAETTSYDCGSAATGPPGVADGMIITTSCRSIVVFTA